MSNDALFDVFDQDEPTPIVDLPKDTVLVQETITKTSTITM